MPDLARTPDHGTEQDLVDKYWIPGKTCLVVCFDDEPIRQLSPKSLGSFRRKRLMTRLRKKYPMFADEFYQRELEAKPQHYFPAGKISD